MADTVSKKIESAAVKLRKEVSAIENCRAKISAAWTGDNAKKVNGILEALSEDLSSRVSELEDAANELKR